MFALMQWNKVNVMQSEAKDQFKKRPVVAQPQIAQALPEQTREEILQILNK